MTNQQPHRIGLLITIVLFVITCLVTIWLFHYLTEPHNRSTTFGFTLAFICLLEFLSFAYFAILIVPYFRERVVTALLPAFGLTLGFYVLVSLVIVVAYNISQVEEVSYIKNYYIKLTPLLYSLSIINSDNAYYSAIAIESVVFLILLGSLIVLNAYKTSADTTAETERRNLVSLSVTVQEVYQSFLNHQTFFDSQTYQDIEAKIKRLKERFQFCTPFGHSNTEVSNKEKEIQNQIFLLGKMIDEIPSKPREELEGFVKDIEDLIMKTLQAMEIREKLLIK